MLKVICKMAFCMLLLTTAIYAQESKEQNSTETKAKESNEKKHSVNASVLGLLTSDYSVNYVNMFSGAHSVVVEGEFQSKSDSKTASNSYGAGVGYRLYMSPKQDAGFLGLQARYRVGGWDTTTIDNNKFSGSSTHYGVVANFGRRWLLESGINITIRVGTGYGKTTFVADQNTAGGKAAEKFMNGFINFLPITFDGELSIGYSF